MQVNVVMQKDNQNTLSEALVANFQRKPKKVSIFCGKLKESGFRIMEEELIDTKIKLFIALGIDKKNTTRSMLEDILALTKDAYIYSNNNLVEFTGSMCAFEFADQGILYISSSNISESGIRDDITLYTEIIYDFTDSKEKTEFKNKIKNLVKEFEKEEFTLLTKDEISRLVKEKEIFTTNQYTHNVKSISELLGKTPEKKEEELEQDLDDVMISKAELPKIDLSDMSIDLDDIDLSGVSDPVIEVDKPIEKQESASQKQVKSGKENKELEIEYTNEEDADIAEKLKQTSVDNPNTEENSLYEEELEDTKFDEKGTLDIADMLFSKADVKLDVSEVKSKKKDKKEEEVLPEDEEPEIVQVKKLNLKNIANFIYELPSKPSKGQDVNSLKIPNYITKMIPEFFELSEKGKNVTEAGVNFKVRDIKLEVVDVKTGNKYTDREARMVHKAAQTYITFTSDILKNIEYTEKDIARIIKLSSDIYHIEIIPKEMQEYKLWSKVCTQTFRSAKRKYGMM